jgi:hypothetical protein
MLLDYFWIPAAKQGCPGIHRRQACFFAQSLIELMLYSFNLDTLPRTLTIQGRTGEWCGSGTRCHRRSDLQRHAAPGLRRPVPFHFSPGISKKSTLCLTLAVTMRPWRLWRGGGPHPFKRHFKGAPTHAEAWYERRSGERGLWRR